MKKGKLSAVEFLQKPYKKQVPDLKASGKKNHLEMLEVVKKLTEKPKSVKPTEMLARKTGGNIIKPDQKNEIVIVGSKPIDISSKQLYFNGAGKAEPAPTETKMKRRSEKVKEIMKLRGLSMTGASKYIKEMDIKY